MRLLVFGVLTCVASVASAAQSPQVSAAPDPQAAGGGAPAFGGDIVVTAQRRSERLVDVPISITALSAATLEQAGIANSRDIVLVTPGLRLDATGNYIQPSIRGITTTLSGGQEANVATYLDGVIQAAPFAAIFDLPDVQQIEVLKGPQGTLFGRNATGGAILIRTIPPSLSEVDGKVTVGYSSFETFRAFGYASAPLVEGKVALGVAGYFEDMNKGYIRDVVTNRVGGGRVNSKLVRAKLRVAPWEGADFTLTGLYARRNDHVVVRNSNYRGNNARVLSGAYTGPLADGPYESSTNIDPVSLTKQRSANLQGTIEMGPGSLNTVTSYAHTTAYVLSDTDLTPQAIGVVNSLFDIKTFSQDLIYSTEQMGRFHAVVGANYYHNDVVGSVLANGTAFVDFNRVKTEAYALFGEGTFDLTDQLKLTAGLRYSHERKAPFKQTQPGNAVRPPLSSFPALAPPKSFKSLDPRISLVYEIENNTNLYATFSRGFKSGEFNPSGAARQVKPINPERVSAYEVGFKTSTAAGLSFNVAGFYYDYTDLQFASYVTTTSGSLSAIVGNAAKAEIKGVEASGDWRVSSAFRLSMGMTYVDGKYKSFPLASFTTPRREVPGNACPVPLNASATAPICTIAGDVSGNHLIRTPEFSGNATAVYTQKTDIGDFDASATLYASTKVYFDVSNRVVQHAYALLNLSLGYTPPNSGLRARAFVRNVTDHAVLQSLVNTTSYDNVTYIPPRAYGVELSFKF